MRSPFDFGRTVDIHGAMGDTFTSLAYLHCSAPCSFYIIATFSSQDGGPSKKQVVAVQFWQHACKDALTFERAGWSLQRTTVRPCLGVWAALTIRYLIVRIRGL